MYTIRKKPEFGFPHTGLRFPWGANSGVIKKNGKQSPERAKRRVGFCRIRTFKEIQCMKVIKTAIKVSKIRKQNRSSHHDKIRTRI